MKTVLTKGSEDILNQEFHCPFCGCEFVSDEFMISSYDMFGTVQPRFEVADECPNCGYRIVKNVEGAVSDGD